MIEVWLEVWRAGPDAMIESFNLLYTYLRFPVYWGLGILWSGWVAWMVKEKERAKVGACEEVDAEW